MRKPIPGWQIFACEDCGRVWLASTRDHLSPSGENCADCGSWVHPTDTRSDTSLETDSSGNLLCGHTESVVKAGRPMMTSLFQQLAENSHSLESYVNHENVRVLFIRYDDPVDGHLHHCYMVDFSENVTSRGEPTLVGCGPIRSRLETILLRDWGMMAVDTESGGELRQMFTTGESDGTN